MKSIHETIARLCLELSPHRIKAIAKAVEESGNVSAVPSALEEAIGPGTAPGLLVDFAMALQMVPNLSAREISGMFRAALATAEASRETSLELVWTGPSTGVVPVRHTEQVLTEVIDGASAEVFLVSFVAFEVPRVRDALERALARGVKLSLLLELSKEHGGNVNVDSFKLQQSLLSGACFFIWDKHASGVRLGASLHAKSAVADRNVAFVTSANLTPSAMERNIEVGVLVRGGEIPSKLHAQLNALIITQIIKPLPYEC